MGFNLLLKYSLPALCAVFLCHSGSLNLLERYLGSVYQEKIENHYIGDTGPLFNGSIRFRDAVRQNIRRFLTHDRGVKFFNLDLNILITSEDGKIDYPAYDVPQTDMDDDMGLWDSVAIARENFDFLHQKRKVVVVTRLGYYSPASALIFSFYLVIACLGFVLIRRNRERILRRSQSQGEIILSLKAREKQLRKEEEQLKKENEISREILKDLEKQRRNLFESLKAARAQQSEELRKAGLNEEEMISEIDRLEKKLSANIELQELKEGEIEALKQKVAKYERRTGGGSRRRTFERVSKRFAVLYKNVDMNRRAFTGFFELKDEQQFKAEEIIQQLDRDAGGVTVKRKVFSGKKHKTTSFEVLFAYNGRLYFRNLEGGRIEILVIGTKNTQNRDMEFLHKV